MSEEEVEKIEYYDGGEAIIVDLGLNIGDRFGSFEDFQSQFDQACITNYVRFSKRDSRTIEAAKRKVKRNFKPELEFYHLRYACFFSQKNKPKGTGQRKRRSLTEKVQVGCPASISLRTTEDGQYLEIYNVENLHNHVVSEEEYKKFLPKKRPILNGLFDNTDISLIEEDCNEEDKYKVVLKKCRHIAKLAAVSDAKRVQEIIKSLDDFIFYLKYTSNITSKEESNKIGIEFNNLAGNSDENIEIIVENENDVMETN